jgi:cation diffusion facilitator CzcD-associated flavoprotein CzcO
MAGAGGSERFETVIVGGGQAGLAVGYHLGEAAAVRRDLGC